MSFGGNCETKAPTTNMMEFAQPPPSTANFSAPPPPTPPVQNASPASTSHGPPHGPSHGPPHERHGNHYNNHHRERHYHGGFAGKGHFRSYNYNRNSAAVQDDFDGKRLRKSVMRKTVDYNSSIVRELEVKLRNFT